MSFEDDKKVADQAQTLQDAVYQKVLPVESVTRYDKGEFDERHILDREHHIDIEVELQNGSILLGQEKALRDEKFGHYNTFTIEFYQNRHTEEKGEFFHIGAQFYFHSYISKDREKLTKWRIIKLFDFIESLKSKPLEELEEQVRATKNSNASFFYINYNDIPDKFVYAYKDEGGDVHYPAADDKWDNTPLAKKVKEGGQEDIGKYM